MLLFINKLNAQYLSRAYGVSIGYSDPLKGFIEIGVSKAKYEAWLSERTSINLAYNPFNNIKGVNLDYDIGFLLCIGLNANTFILKDEFQYGLMPKIGIGIPMLFSIMYGYNILINDNLKNDLTAHNFSLRINIPINRTIKELPKDESSSMFWGLYKPYKNRKFRDWK